MASREGIVEPGYNLLDSFKHMLQNINPAGVGTGLVATLFSTMGPGMIVYTSAQKGQLTDAQAVSWLFALYAFGGIATMITALRYRMPVVIAYSIPGAVLLGTVLGRVPLNEAVGAYILVGLATLILTLTGVIKKVVENIPVPIMLGMVAGVLFSFGVNMFSAAVKMPQIYGIMLLVFFGVMAFKAFSEKFPPILIAMAVGVVLLGAFGQVKPIPLNFALSSPVFQVPSISLQAILEISVPLFFLVIGVQNIQAVGVLLAEDYKPPINWMYLIPSIGAFINAIQGAHCAVTAGPSTAICSSSAAHPRKDLRYIAAFWEGVFWFVFALLAYIIVESVKMVPAEFTAVIAGLAMFEVFTSVFKGAYAGKFRAGAVVAMFIAVANLPILNVGAPFWAIVFGVGTSLLVERDDFAFAKNGKATTPAIAAAK